MKLKSNVTVYFLLISIIVVLIILNLGTQRNFDLINKVNDDLLVQLDTNEENYKKSKNLLSEDLADKREDYTDLLLDYNELKGKYTKLKKKSNKAKIPVYHYDEGEIRLLCMVCQAEAGEENYSAQKMIAQVVLNRVASEDFPNNITDVIYQKSGNVPQFSVAYNGLLDKQIVSDRTYIEILKVLLNGYELPSNVLYFYDNSVEENWVNTLRTYAVMQGTVFAYEN